MRELSKPLQVMSRDNGQGWTYERINDDVIRRRTDWLHSDFRNVAMPFVCTVYEKMLAEAELTQETSQ